MFPLALSILLSLSECMLWQEKKYRVNERCAIWHYCFQTSSNEGNDRNRYNRKQPRTRHKLGARRFQALTIASKTLETISRTSKPGTTIHRIASSTLFFHLSASFLAPFLGTQLNTVTGTVFANNASKLSGGGKLTGRGKYSLVAWTWLDLALRATARPNEPSQPSASRLVTRRPVEKRASPSIQARTRPTRIPPAMALRASIGLAVAVTIVSEEGENAAKEEVEEETIRRGKASVELRRYQGSPMLTSPAMAHARAASPTTRKDATCARASRRVERIRKASLARGSLALSRCAKDGVPGRTRSARRRIGSE
jgi:hypothetical protein